MCEGKTHEHLCRRQCLLGIIWFYGRNFPAVTPWWMKCKVLSKLRMNKFITEPFAHLVTSNPLQTLISLLLCFSWNIIISIMGDMFSCVGICLSATSLLLRSMLFLLVGILLGAFAIASGWAYRWALCIPSRGLICCAQNNVFSISHAHWSSRILN